MTHDAVSPLRKRMIKDMTIRRFGEHTKRDCIRQVREFAVLLGRAPDRAEPEDLRRYQLHMASLGASYARMNLASTALRFFFHVTLSRTGFGDRMARIPTPERLPVVLSLEEVALLAACPRTARAGSPAGRAFSCACACSRGFLPWRFSSAGSQPRHNRRAGAAIRKPSQKRKVAHRREADVLLPTHIRAL